MKKVVVIILILLVISLGVGGYIFMNSAGQGVFNGSMQMVTNQETTLKIGRDQAMGRGFDVDEFESTHTLEPLRINSSWDQHQIPGVLIRASQEKGIVILVHGMSGNRISVYPEAEMFLRNGYHVLAYDQRSSGENTAPYTTYGVWESKDLLDYIRYVEDAFPEGTPIILWGTSFGGATVGIALGDPSIQDKVEAAILDSPISSMEDMIAAKTEEMGIPFPTNLLMKAGSFYTNRELGFSFQDGEVTQYTATTTIPTLVMNSQVDTVTPYYMGEEIYHSLTVEKKELFTVPDSKHGDLYNDYPEEYENAIINFLL